MVSALAGCDTLSLFMDTFILYPTDTLFFTPPDLGYTDYDEIMLPSGEHDHVAIWHVRTTQERKGIIVGLGGIGDNKSRYVLGIPIVQLSYTAPKIRDVEAWDAQRFHL